jgi:nucleotidyltransferase substrate binding protein (TIGR01987 family)
MDIKVKRDQTNRALSSLLELVVKFSDDSSDVIVRDAMVQRFEYTTEAFWKYLKHYLQTEHNLLANSPREVMRMGLQAKLYDEATSKELLQMLDDRNLTSHTYIE